ncbi:O-antigen ligase family protein [Dehalococcoidia bacterium]|nr:O-antigen ligase family protein [Dehalococcoidia bacterium]
MAVAIAAMGVLVAAYGIAQHYGHDFLDLMEPPNGRRASSTLGNATFAAALLMMTIPVSAAFGSVALGDRFRNTDFWWKLGLWSLILAVQFCGIVFASSRGPWLGAITAFLVFLVLTGFFVGWRHLARAGLILGLASVLTAIVLLWPTQPPAPGRLEEVEPTAGASAVSRISTIASPIGQPVGGSGLAGRIDIWKGSWRLMTDHPWFEFDNLSLTSLRPLIGYGPDLFRYTYLLQSPPKFDSLPSEAAHAHNYFLHQGVELGFLGLGASLALFASVFLVGDTIFCGEEKGTRPCIG